MKLGKREIASSLKLCNPYGMQVVLCLTATRTLRFLARRKICLMLSLIVFSFSIALVNVQAQSTPIIPFIANATNQPPTINGQWEPAEWENAVTYNLTVGASQVTERPSIRLLHDNATLYGLIDVPSQKSKIGGDVLLFFYYGIVRSTTLTQTRWDCFLQNQTGYSPTGIGWSPANSSMRANAFLAQKHFKAYANLASTELSKTKHRIWEFSIQLFPYFILNPLTENSTTIGFNVVVNDGTGTANLMYLVGMSQPGRLIFVDTALPVSEVSSASAVFLLSLLASLPFVRRSRSNMRRTSVAARWCRS